MKPNTAQEYALNRMAGARRFVWNWALARWTVLYAATGKSIALKQLSDGLTAAELCCRSRTTEMVKLTDDAALLVFFVCVRRSRILRTMLRSAHGRNRTNHGAGSGRFRARAVLANGHRAVTAERTIGAGVLPGRGDQRAPILLVASWPAGLLVKGIP